jgi:transcriptional regulator with XRE-family HTH domain
MSAQRRTLGPRFTEGARLLWLWLAASGISQKELGRRVGAPAITKILYGDHIPRVAVLSRLCELIGAPVSVWAEPPREPFVPPLVVAEREAFLAQKRARRRPSQHAAQ